MKFEYWFPTVVASYYVPIEISNRTKDIIREWVEDKEHLDYLEPCKEDNLITSYFKWHDTLGDLGLSELKQEIVNCAMQFAKHFGLSLDEGRLRVDSWINFFYPNQSEQQHNHYGNFISGVYYVSAPDKSGVYRFFDPAGARVMWAGLNLKDAESNHTNRSSGQYVPEEGKLLMFPSWLDHSVLANKSNEIRISIAFNVNIIG